MTEAKEHQPTRWRPLCPETLRWCAHHLRVVTDRHGLNGTPTENGYTRPSEFTVELNGVYADQWNRLERERREFNRPCWFFGVWPGTGGGHYFRGRDSRRAEKKQPFGYPDGNYQPDNGQKQGPAALSHLNGWTCLAWWDRSEDTRPGCCSALIFKGEYSFDSMVEVLKARFPKIYARRKLTPWRGKIMKEVKRR